MKKLKVLISLLLLSGLLLFQACDENNDLFVNSYPVYDEDLLNFEGITETDENGKKISNIDPDDWLQLYDDQIDESFYPQHSGVFISEFIAEYSSGKVFINWTTQWETDFLFWNILRNDENNPFNADIINEEHIPAIGNTIEPTNYVYIDEYITTNETYYYFLELTKVDSSLTYFGPMTLTIPSLSFGPAYPNPTEDQAIIPIHLSEEKEIAMYVINETGDLLDVLMDDDLQSGLHNIICNASDKENGLYRVIFHCKNDTLHHYGDILVEH